MSQENRLEKTNRINRLFDFYEPLLTEKQQMFLKYYFHDDFSLGEIASEFQISRQAVYEHIKRAEQVLEMYEEKLGLLSKHERRIQDLEELNATLYDAFGKVSKPDKDTLQHVQQIVNRLQEL
ncbi:DNA-binding protein [Paenibacillus jamilae]|uniref:DNA-binding protein n=1 Tax=Paenibacillus jamilae TaxID=114136 RepID=A0ACC4ZXV1_9BACL|nr:MULTISPECIES: YlxM family DNA-binding protein [Paenibacillus]AUO09274.1 DNA-binding protein [Paenibacillus sp. lzh-N1]KTS83469.1 DNA-binding protein [Paenibacillus jamilae]